MTEVMEALIPYFFRDLDYPQLTAEADPRNAASVGILESLGFRQTGEARHTFCINGEWSDSVYFALTRP